MMKRICILFISVVLVSLTMLSQTNDTNTQGVMSSAYHFRFNAPRTRSSKKANKAQESFSPAYHFHFENKSLLLQQLQDQDNIRQSALQQQLESFNANLKSDSRVGDAIKMSITPTVEIQKSATGEDEANLILEFSYETKMDDEIHIKVAKRTDDYPGGAYLPTQSKACKTTLAFLKKKVDEDLAQYFTAGTNVTIKITGITDGTPIRKVIPYKGEYGDFNSEMVYLNDEVNEISIDKQHGITSNAQLAFLRTQGVKHYLETFVDNLGKTNNRYQIYAMERPEIGSQYRKIAVEITIHKAFNQQLSSVSSIDLAKETPTVSDVDENIPESRQNNTDTYVIIFANEKYNEIVGEVPFAHNDGEIFMQYCQQTLGVNPRQIRLIKDATRNQLEDAMDWITGIANVRSDARFIVYYAGHGVPNGDEAYLLPIDANPEKPQQLWSLNQMYSRLSNLPSKSIVCLIDACFSGTRRNGEPLINGWRGVAIRERPTPPIHGNLVVLSAAEAKQTAYPFAEQKHGLFTYFLLKKLQQSNGHIAINQLFTYIHDNVRLEAALNTHEQTPCLQVSSDLADSWKKWMLK